MNFKKDLSPHFFSIGCWTVCLLSFCSGMTCLSLFFRDAEMFYLGKERPGAAISPETGRRLIGITPRMSCSSHDYTEFLCCFLSLPFPLQSLSDSILYASSSSLRATRCFRLAVSISLRQMTSWEGKRCYPSQSKILQILAVCVLKVELELEMPPPVRVQHCVQWPCASQDIGALAWVCLGASCPTECESLVRHPTFPRSRFPAAFSIW